MEVIILAGGYGTRLNGVVSNIPKPMADINGRPFLEIILDWLKEYDITKCVLAVSYLKEVIMDHFKNQYGTIQIEYSVEEKPLGTGGAIKKALAKCQDRCVGILNGDSYLNVDLNEMRKIHLSQGNDLSIAVREVSDASRYGTVLLKGNSVIQIEEKNECIKKGLINGGVYIMERDLVDIFPTDASFSFEKDILEKYVCSKKFGAFISQGYFVDIGIPEDYHRARMDLL